jgi:hypothetical protein
MKHSDGSWEKLLSKIHLEPESMYAHDFASLTTNTSCAFTADHERLYFTIAIAVTHELYDLRHNFFVMAKEPMGAT